MMVVRRKTWLNVRFKIDYNHKNEVIKKNFTSSHLFEKKKEKKKEKLEKYFYSTFKQRYFADPCEYAP